jgi:hypothetical protein
MTNPKGAPAPTPNALRQREFRARKKAAQLHEVRGIFATDEDEAAIKAFAKKLANSKHTYICEGKLI